MSAHGISSFSSTIFSSSRGPHTATGREISANFENTFNAAALPFFTATAPPSPASELTITSPPTSTSSIPMFPAEHTVTPHEYYIQYVAFLMKHHLISAGSQQIGFIYRHLRELQRTVTDDPNELLGHSARFTAELTPQLGGADDWIHDWMEHLEGFIRDSGRCGCENCVGEPRKWWLDWVEEI